MPFLPKLKERIASLVAGIKSVFADFLARAADVAQRLLEKIPERRRRLVMIAAGGLVALLLVIAGISLATRSGSGSRRVSSAQSGQPGGSFGEPQRVIIPPDELFLPFEPDFVPGVILEREQRSEWTAEDAVPLWQDPLRNGEQEWRDMIEKTIDEIMESVP